MLYDYNFRNKRFLKFRKDKLGKLSLVIISALTDRLKLKFVNRGTDEIVDIFKLTAIQLYEDLAASSNH